MSTIISPTRTRRGRRLPLAAGVAALGLLLGACGSSGGSSAASSTKPVTLTILTHVNPPTQQALATLDKAFTAKYPYIHVQVTAVPTNNVPSVRDTRIQAGNLDITEVDPFLGGKNPSYVKGQPPNIWGELVEAHKFLDLKGQAFLKDYSPDAISQVGQVGSGVYAIPTGRDIFTGVYYNKAIFAKYGLHVPTTWNQLMSVCQVLKSHGVTPFIIGQKDGWPAGLPMYAVQQDLYPTLASRYALEKATWVTPTAFKTPTAVQVLEKTKAIYGYTKSGFAGIAYANAPGDFAVGQAAMMPDGTWTEPQLVQANKNLSFGYFPLPATNNPKINAQWGGKYDIAWSVLSSSPHQADALKWMAFYSAKANYGKFMSTAGFIPAEPGVATNAFNASLHATDANFSDAFSTIAISKANASTQAGFDYLDIAPLGKAYTNMNQLADIEQAAWNRA